ncbi:sulfatase [Cyclobacterium amurskyense]|uniref:Choline-sulfatase n=1 Tax=Cyclobacterium amurskyense TaxID=320787 RepID=A0A0H4PEW3_9BACT|nr:sulfatase [Cyclobacterium amurskyense]AKP52996.1 Choline-sulfatase [Cyclobacterium amurskyense]|tara:strand:- start:3757 stop:5253 length:1497 start_codon:yes stop_codon:yes gene_type:complete
MSPKNILLYCLIFTGLFQSCGTDVQEKKPYNILFIAIDDLRPELGIYGNEIIKTPNLDAIGNSGTIFENHYVQVPTCGASRCSILTGMLPSSRAHLKNSAIEKMMADVPEGERPESFVHHLKRNGYYTVGIGKISHSIEGLVYGYEESPEGAKAEMPYSWDEMLFDAGKWGNGWNAFFGYADGSNRQGKKKQVKPYEAGDVSDEGYPDGLSTQLAIKKLRELADKEEPFFMGLGLFKPHLPFTSPKKYWDLYDRDEIPLSGSPDIPENIDLSSLQRNGEFNQYALGEEKASLEQPLSDEYARKLRHAYYAAVSYSDALVGKVMQELDELGLSDNTIVVVWGDHGWHLGDQRVWGKHTIFETALRSPLIIKVPGQEARRISSEMPVSSIDLYPTLMELTDIPTNFPLDGQSLMPLIKEGKDESREALAFSYFNNGISMRTDKYRLMKYFREETPKIELYDHVNDPLETKNIAAEQPELVEQLLVQLEKGDTGLYSKKNN